MSSSKTKNNLIEIDGGKYAYCPKTGFGAVNNNNCLKYVLVGITPGTNQTPAEAEKEAKENGYDFGSVEYKFWKAFNGTKMRNNLNNMFKHINENIHKGLLDDLLTSYENICDLFEFKKNESIIDFTSLLKDATYKYNKKNDDYVFFNTPKDIAKEKNEELFEMFENGFKQDYENVYSKKENIIFIACGRQVYNFLIRGMHISEKNVIAIVHPSPAAQGYINAFLEKNKNKTYNPERLY